MTDRRNFEINGTMYKIVDDGFYFNSKHSLMVFNKRLCSWVHLKGFNTINSCREYAQSVEDDISMRTRN